MSPTLSDLAKGIDAACDSRNVQALAEYRESIAVLDRAEMSAVDRAALAFYEANICAALRAEAVTSASSDWAEPRLEEEIRALRVARREIGNRSTSELRTDLKLRVLTNLANVLNRCGRTVEAIELWDEVLVEHPRFGMAMGNRALALYWYGRYAENPVEQAILLSTSYQSLSAALHHGVESHARSQMEELALHLKIIANWDEIDFSRPTFPSGRSALERQYRRWCIEQRAVLAPRNDVDQKAQALQDTLTLPSLTVPADNRVDLLPRPYAIFNQLKQEYVSARFLVFEALNEKGERLHFADKGVVLYDTLDYRFYRTWIEKLKMAFVALHAIFDKVAYLVNEYWSVGLDARDVSFARVWYSGGRASRGLAKEFAASDNWPLRGLYWLSRDFHMKAEGEGSADPEASVLHGIRNHRAQVPARARSLAVRRAA